MGARCSFLASTTRKSYDDLPSELLDRVIARLPDPGDRARARAVCRSWHTAVRRHGPQPWRLPKPMSLWRLIWSLPAGADIVGSTNDWLAIQVGNERATKEGRGHHSYLMYNPSWKRTVPLPELEDIMVQNHKSMVYKFLMRSGVDDLIAVITNNMMHAFMVILPGKGVWLPPPRTRPYTDVIDFAFLQGKLYAITRAEDLIPFDLAVDVEGRPVVTMGSRLINQNPDYNEREQLAAARRPDDITTHNCSGKPWPYTGVLKMTSWHLIESRGKLLMVRHNHQLLQSGSYITFGVEVFEADTGTGAWTPVTGGLGGGRALFVSRNFSKSVAAPCGQVEEDVIYFIDTGEGYNLKSGTSSPSQLCRSLCKTTWLFYPELVF